MTDTDFDQRVREALTGAAQILRDGRWIQDWYEEPTEAKHLQRDGYCVMGAIRKSVGGDAVKGYDVREPLTPAKERIVEAAAEKLVIVLDETSAMQLTDEEMDRAYPTGQAAIDAAIGWNDGHLRHNQGKRVIEALEAAARHE